MRIKGVTLVEILVVITIVLIISAIAFMVLGPRSKWAGIETEIRADLKSYLVALNIYMSDNDGQYPNDSRGLATMTKIRWRNGEGKNLIRTEPYVGSGQLNYSLVRNLSMRRADARCAGDFPWDPQKYQIVTAGLSKIFGPHKWELNYPFCRYRWRDLEGQDIRALAGFEDGSVRWASVTTDYEHERIPCQ